MCEPTDALKMLRDIPFRVASLENALPQGGYERALARCVYDSVRMSIDYAVKQIEQERQRFEKTQHRRACGNREARKTSNQFQ